MQRKFWIKSLAALIVFVLTMSLIGCTQKDTKLIIPDTYQKAVVINCFEDTWSTTEDGSDWIDAVEFSSDTTDFRVISDYLAHVTLSEVDNSGNFTPDFSFTNGNSQDNSYDFIFYSDDLLVMRDPNGSCKKVDISETDYYDLKEYIGEMRLGISMGHLVGGYSDFRELTDEDSALFNQVMADITGVGYVPDSVATQVVAGINYIFRATATPVTGDNTEPYSVNIYIFQPLDGSPTLTNIEKVGTE